VAPIAGTTRDIVEATVELGGVPVTFVDTAGLRETDDFVEAEGVRRARQRAGSADLILHVIDAASGDLGAALPMGTLPDGVPRLVIANKIDLVPAPAGTVGVSATTAEGLDALAARLAALARDLTLPAGTLVLTRMRHLTALADASAALQQALAAPLPELRGEDLRRAMRCLGTVTGDVDVEAILDTVFGSFCIGK
jgi:tRNA modification GTPase